MIEDMKKVIVFLMLVNFALAGGARGLWVKTRTQPDKVEQTFGDEIYLYYFC